ncbi:MAG: Pilus assembly protein PilO [Gaiellaceae bacterium]|nr:Pilus assembly protein PilO [Gaiellaceae bacterium]MDX6469120.1 Pilus assembly protein PilO [Gaiellaceae bacterium]MDX6472080.1 Pilus assembly protein PilO [Gaiellaceae bacterium]
MKAAKAKKLSRNGGIALIVGGDLLLLVLGWFMLISPQRATAQSIRLATSAAEAQIVQAKQVAATPPPAAIQQPEIKTADIYSLADAMPSTIDMPDLLLELNQLARAAGVTVTKFSPGQPTALTGYSVEPLGIGLEGDFYTITDMLYRMRTLVAVRHGDLQTSGRLFSVDSITLGPSGKGVAGLTADVALNAYLYGGTPPVVPVAPAATSTDTTSTTTTTTPAPSADVAPAP